MYNLQANVGQGGGTKAKKIIIKERRNKIIEQGGHIESVK